MSLIISIETSTPVCGIAVHDSGELKMEVSLHIEKSHARELARQVQLMMETLQLDYAKLSGVAVAGGPGSYTGLRIGTSFAKGLCYAHDLPLFAVSSLSAMAHRVQQMIGADAFYFPMMDARRMEVYAEIQDTNFETLLPQQPLLLEEYDFEVWLDQKPCYFFGDGSAKAETVISHPNARFVQGIVPSAHDIGVLAWGMFQREEQVDVAYFEPEYLKEFQATKPKKIF